MTTERQEYAEQGQPEIDPRLLPVQNWTMDMQKIGVIGPNGKASLVAIWGGAFQVLLTQAGQANPLSTNALCARLYGAVDEYNLPATRIVVEKLQHELSPTGLQILPSQQDPDSYYIGIPEQRRYERLVSVINQRHALMRKILSSDRPGSVNKKIKRQFGRRGSVRRKVKRSISRLYADLENAEHFLQDNHIPIPEIVSNVATEGVADRVRGVIFDAAGLVYDKFHTKEKREITRRPVVEEVVVTPKEQETKETEEEKTITKEKRFGNLTPLEIGLIVTVLTAHPDRFAQFLHEQGIEPFERDVMARLVVGTRDLVIQYDSTTVLEQQRDAATERRMQAAFRKIEKLVGNPDRDRILDAIYHTDQDVWYLLMGMTDVVPAVRRVTPNSRLSFLRALEHAVVARGGIIEGTRSDIDNEEEVILIPESEQLAVAAEIVVAQRGGEKRVSGIEGRDRDIRRKINAYLDQIAERADLRNLVSPGTFTRAFPRVKQTKKDEFIKAGWVSIIGNEIRHSLDSVGMATLLYLSDNAEEFSLTSGQKNQVEKIAREEKKERE